MPTNQEEPREQGLIEKKGKQLLRNKLFQVGKKAAKVAVQVAAKAVLAATKSLLAILGGIGLPYIAILLAILVGLFLIFLAISLIFSGDPESLSEEERKFHEHIMTAADNTVDMERPEQILYRVPHELLIAAMQIYDTDSKMSSEDAVDQLAEALRPIFTYETHEATLEVETTVCTDGACSTSTSITNYDVELLVHVEAWDRIMEAEVIPVTTVTTESSSSSSTNEDGTTSTTTVTVVTTDHSFKTEETITMDYTLFDRELSKKPFKYEEKSKLAVEAIYEIIGGYILYTEWLNGDSLTGIDGIIIPGDGVPLEYMPYYLEAQKKYNVDWYILAAIHWVETKFSTHHPMISSVGAQGHMQFMPCTWIGWSYPGCMGGVGFVDIPDSILHDPAMIKKYGGLGVDSDGDGKADPWNVKDAIFSAANLLNQAGYSSNIDGAIRKYNKSDKYVNDVKAKGDEFKYDAEYIPSNGGNVASGSLIRPTTGIKTSPYGQRNGRLHAGVDIASRKGTPIVSIADGVVTHAACFNPCTKAWGLYVKVRYTIDGQIYEALYGHFDTLAVTKGQVVKQGQILGGMGNSGAVIASPGGDGTHLHFEMHRGGYQPGGTTSFNPELMVPI